MLRPLLKESIGENSCTLFTTASIPLKMGIKMASSHGAMDWPVFRALSGHRASSTPN